MIDTHCHLTFPKLRNRVDEVLAAAEADGVHEMITIGTTPSDVEAARSLADERHNVRFAAGIHPHEAGRVALSEVPPVFEAAKDGRFVAFGEMGLDYHYDVAHDVQRELFQSQLELVASSDVIRPVVLHCREAIDDTLAAIQASRVDGSRFVFHCFSGTAEDVRRVLDIGAMVSFTGIVTYKNAPEVREAAQVVPDDRIMVETDAPYLTPEPHRKVRPNEPRYVAATARFLAELRGVPFERFVEQADANARRFYKLVGA